MSMRLPPSIVVHNEHYDETGLEADLASYDARRNERQPIAPNKQRHADKYGTAAYYPWSENAARQLSVPERPEFSRFLNKHGFALS
jgi:nitroreductase/FMN reductase [NAD(P)H]